jgi:hypothetical protein
MMSPFVSTPWEKAFRELRRAARRVFFVRLTATVEYGPIAVGYRGTGSVEELYGGGGNSRRCSIVCSSGRLPSSGWRPGMWRAC